MEQGSGPERGPEFYTELRYPQSAEANIRRYCAALRALHARAADDLRTGRRGRFSSLAEGEWEPLAVAAERTAGHADVLESLLLGAPDADGEGVRLRAAFANIVSDSNFAEVAERHVHGPKAREGKFDTAASAHLLALATDYAQKLKDVADLFGLGAVVALLNFIIAILKDIGLFGRLMAGPAKNEIARQVEDKLEYVIGQDEALETGQRSIADGQAAIRAMTDQINREVLKIEKKADELGRLLGLTLVSQEWIVDPDATRDHPNKTPAHGVKDELHEIELLLKIIITLVNPPPIIEIVPPPPVHGPVDQPKKTPPPPVFSDPRLKKIYVYADNVFRAQAAGDSRTIRVKTAAFDLSGWLDLTRLRQGDVFETEIRVSLAHANDLLFARAHFAVPGLYAFADMARGQNFISGNHVDIVLRQTDSADGFRTAVPAAYQFVVESQ